MEFLQTVLFYFVAISEINYVLSSKNGLANTGNVSIHDNTTLCTTDKCVMKCCPFGKVLNKRVLRKKSDRTKTKTVTKCDNYHETRDISNLDFYNKPNFSIFDVKSGIFEVNTTLLRNSMDVVFDKNFNIHLNEHAEILLEKPNVYDRWIRIPNNMYCWEYIIVNDTQHNTTSLEPRIWIEYQNSPDESKDTSSILMTSAMLVSSFFLLLVLVVYGLLPELRNLCGLILMSYVTSLLGAFLLLAVIRVRKHDLDACISLTLLIYFFFMASFCWMFVMSFDIWWTFRGYAKARPIHQRGKRFKFLMYCLYAWGVPLAMTIALIILNNTDMRHIPWFIKPNLDMDSCFFKAGEQLLYLYMPMLILILCNWMFYLMTAFNIWRLSRGTAVLDSAAAGTPQAHRTHRRRFLVYLKLSIVMGLNWLLEVVSSLYPNSKAWILSDFYNILIGVSIFFIFVCKRKILKKLKQRFSKNSQWQNDQTHSKETATSNSDSSGTQEKSHQNGKFVINLRNQVVGQWYVSEDKFCVERMVAKVNDSNYKGTYLYYYISVQDNDNGVKIIYTGVATLISSFFLVLVLLVYCALPQLRNLAGMILMVYVATLLIAFVTKATLNFMETTIELCQVVYPIIYFLFLSSFLWLNIMSFDMWYTFRSVRLNRPLHRQGEVAKFLWYGLYAWGVAAAMTIFAVLIDISPLTNWPNVIKPGFYFCNTGGGTLRYQYAPISIILSMNIVLFLMTIHNIWLINKGLNDFSSSRNNKKNQMRFRLYVRMSLLMGISWVLEVMQVFLKNLPVWVYALLNLYNAGIGVTIFFLFVFNMPTLLMLCKRFNIENQYVRDWKANSSMRTTMSRPSSSNTKGSYNKTRTTDAADVEMFDFAKSPK